MVFLGDVFEVAHQLPDGVFRELAVAGSVLPPLFPIRRFEHLHWAFRQERAGRPGRWPIGQWRRHSAWPPRRYSTSVRR